MKKWIFLILLFITAQLFAYESFVFSNNSKTKNLTYSFSEKGLRYMVSLNQDEEGTFSLSAPPFITVKYKNGIKIGELKFSDSSDSISMKPALSGIMKSFDRFDIAVISPILNPLSPSGFFVSWHNANVKASLMRTDYGNRARRGLDKNYQIDWKALPSFNDSLDMKLDLRETVKGDNVMTTTSAMCNFIYDYDLGYSGTCGWNIVSEGEKIRFELSDSYGTGRENLKGNMMFSLRTKGVLNFGFSYNTKTYPMPIYGGSSKGYLVEYATIASYRGFSFSGKHNIEIKEDSGHVESSRYDFRYYRPDMKNNFLSLKGSIQQNRGEVYSVSEFLLKFRDKNAMLEFTGSKTLLTLSYSWILGDVKFKASVTQDRTFTLSSNIRR